MNDSGLRILDVPQKTSLGSTLNEIVSMFCNKVTSQCNDGVKSDPKPN